MSSERRSHLSKVTQQLSRYQTLGFSSVCPFLLPVCFLNYETNFIIKLEVLIQNLISLNRFLCFSLSLLSIYFPFFVSIFYLFSVFQTSATRPLFIHSFMQDTLSAWLPGFCLLSFFENDRPNTHFKIKNQQYFTMELNNINPYFGLVKSVGNLFLGTLQDPKEKKENASHRRALVPREKQSRLLVQSVILAHLFSTSQKQASW